MKNKDSYESLNLRKNKLLKLAEKQLEISKHIDGTDAGLTLTEKASGIVDRLKSDYFKLLVMGCFSSGKSTFLNALLKEKILPSSATPCTGVLTFLKYATTEKQKIILYKKDGTTPIEIKGDDLKNVLKENVKIPRENQAHPTDATESTPYEKAELYYPLEFCKNGVEIIDSVGLNDPQARDKITEDYAKSADAIVYCMTCQQANTAKDKNTTMWLSKLGFKNIFFVLTYYDALLSNCEENDDESIEDVVKNLKRDLKTQTELGEKGIFFVDSRGVLKKNPDSLKLFRLVEEGLEKFLVSEKGLSKLRGNIEQLILINNESLERIRQRNNMLSKNATDIEKKIRLAKIPLENRRKERDEILKDFDDDSNDILEKIQKKTENFIPELRNSALDFVENYEFTSNDIEERKSELCEAVEEYFKEKFVDFQKNLINEISPEINALERRTKRNFEKFTTNIYELKENLELNNPIIVPNAKTDIAITASIFGGSFLVGFLFGGISIFLGPIAIFGFNAIKKYLETKKLKEKISNAISEKFLSNSEKFSQETVSAYKNKFNEIKNTISQELNAQINSIESDLKKTLDAHNGNKNKLVENIKLFNELQINNEDLSKDLKNFKTLID